MHAQLYGLITIYADEWNIDSKNIIINQQENGAERGKHLKSREIEWRELSLK